MTYRIILRTSPSMRSEALASGGKDSLYATYLANREREHEVCVLVTIKSLNLESYMYHDPNIMP